MLTCIRHQTTLDAGRHARLAPNAERYLKPPAVMARALRRSAATPCARRATSPNGSSSRSPISATAFPTIRCRQAKRRRRFCGSIAEVGARDRYRPYHDRARAQIARELDLIEKLQLAGYFLIVWDIVRLLPRQRDSSCRAAARRPTAPSATRSASRPSIRWAWSCSSSASCRKSAASGRTSIWICRAAIGASASFSTSTSDTDELGAAMTANVITYRGRSAAREVGKVLGFDAGEIDRLAQAHEPLRVRRSGRHAGPASGEAGLDPDDRRACQQFARLWREMQDLPRHLGQHSGGMVICQGRLDEVVPLENARMPGRVVVQWDKDDCADMGIVKVDLLGLGMMAVLEDALALVN